MTMPARLGDILIRKKQIAPHQLGVALAVQRRSRLPLGEILIQTRIINRVQLVLALMQQKIARRFGGGKQQVGRYGHEMVSWGRALLEQHVKHNVTAENKAAALNETVRLRSELAKLPRQRAGRIVENDEALKERILSGNF